jgi:2-amino-4-hydroxy-6-hydroxymethyldihydropteridine diphosphokinase
LYLRKKSNMERVFLLLGSNQGKREEVLTIAKVKLAAKIGVLIAGSSYFETAPWGDTNQADFINQVLEFETDFSPEDLLETILEIEVELGRIRLPEARYGARSIDIDILYYGQLILDTDALTIPHPRIQERRFALAPMVEIAEDFLHPIFNLPQKEMLAKCSDSLAVKKLKGNQI